MFVVRSDADIVAIRMQANHEKNDDLLGAIETLDYALQSGVVTLPVSITMPDPPDAVSFSGGNPVFAVEVRRVTWKRLRHVEAHAKPWGVDAQGKPIRGDLIELTPDLCLDEAASRDKGKGTPKGSRTGHFRAIKKPGEKLDGDGWLGDEMRTVTLETMRTAVTEKQANFERYSKTTRRVWLFLIADGIAGAWDDILSDADLRWQAEAIAAASDFERVLLFRFARGMSEVFSKTERP